MSVVVEGGDPVGATEDWMADCELEGGLDAPIAAPPAAAGVAGAATAAGSADAAAADAASFGAPPISLFEEKGELSADMDTWALDFSLPGPCANTQRCCLSPPPFIFLWGVASFDPVPGCFGTPCLSGSSLRGFGCWPCGWVCGEPL